MATMEGPLSKWTNVVKGWQYRWFVLDDGTGLLSYYTSKEKMIKGSCRGCVRLKNARIGIDDEDQCTFTVTVDNKTFHFQARDADEREKWIRALENTIYRHSILRKKFDVDKRVPTVEDFDRKLSEADAYLQILIDQIQLLESRFADEPQDENFNAIVSKANELLGTVKHSIVLVQIAKNTAHPINGVYRPNILDTPELASAAFSGSTPELRPRTRTMPMRSRSSDVNGGSPGSSPPVHIHLPGVPVSSYSSSDDEDFFDVDESMEDLRVSPPSGNEAKQFENHVEAAADESNRNAFATDNMDESDGCPVVPIPEQNDCMPRTASQLSLDSSFVLPASSKFIKEDGTIDYDAIYEKEEDDLGNLEGQSSVIGHLLSQVKIGMDLTKVVLPTFILERRSLLEMYADFFAHPDIFMSVTDGLDPRDRMMRVVRWYLSSFHAGRRSAVAKKPYNPIIGETFRCSWDIPGYRKTTEKCTNGPLPWATTDQLVFISEQVSHHPPISAFYSEHLDRRVSFSGHIWTKSKFLGLSIGVQMIGQGVITLLDLNEEYVVTFPSGYGRSILTVPWVELGGATTVTCPTNGYNATVQFHTKPFYGGKKNRLTCEVFDQTDKKPFVTITGEWNGQMVAKWADGRTEDFVDTQSIPIIRKTVQPVHKQDLMESRRLWMDCTASLMFKDIQRATKAKFRLEQKQREEAKQRAQLNQKWQTKNFHLVNDNWQYNNHLRRRLSEDRQ